jgi:hypothetical protein
MHYHYDVPSDLINPRIITSESGSSPLQTHTRATHAHTHLSSTLILIRYGQGATKALAAALARMTNLHGPIKVGRASPLCCSSVTDAALALCKTRSLLSSLLGDFALIALRSPSLVGPLQTTRQCFALPTTRCGRQCTSSTLPSRCWARSLACGTFRQVPFLGAVDPFCCAAF